MGTSMITKMILKGAAAFLGQAINDQSVGLIMTDPVYEDMNAYYWLGEFAARVLRPGAALLAFCSIGLLPKTLAALDWALTYRWELTSAWTGGAGRGGPGFCKQARLL